MGKSKPAVAGSNMAAIAVTAPNETAAAGIAEADESMSRNGTLARARSIAPRIQGAAAYAINPEVDPAETDADPSGTSR